MSEGKPEAKKSGWFKAILGAIGGVLSGAAVMWVSPWVDKVVKPAKPIANFAVEHTGLTVTFRNHSVGGSEGRWDFGDGSPLEFIKPDEPAVKHSYPRTGTYQAKLILKNSLGEESERAVTVELTDGSSQAPAKPAILDLYVRPPGKVGQPVYAPATYQFEAACDNAQLYLWDFGDGRGVQLGEHNASYTYASPGTYTITLTAFSGKQKSQHDVTVDVYEPPTGLLNISLMVLDQGVQVESRQREATVSAAIPLNGRNDPATIERAIAATAGFEIAAVELRESRNQNVEKAAWQIAPDKKSVKVTAKVLKMSSPTSAVLNERFVVTERRRKAATREPIAIAGTMAAPGTASMLLPPVPEDWTDVRRQFTFELRQNDRILWQGPQLPGKTPVTVNGRPYTLGATTSGERVQINLLGRTE